MSSPIVLSDGTSEVAAELDCLLNLEDGFYKQGFDLGTADGSRAGRAEGRVFGLEKGFEKFAEIAKLQGQAIFFQSRLPQPFPTKVSDSGEKIPGIPENPRLQKHVASLMALTDLDSLSITNDENSVTELDDRLKRARAKLKLIGRIIGETQVGLTSNPAARLDVESGIESINVQGTRS
ncbi:MAG: hypothetical protein M1814_001674 [Vezdaea aestivalis]|nr:MAG: hypothetical protein M1814_001674 [Vezdaea aestivalis]